MRGKTNRSCTVLALIIFGVVPPLPVTFADDAAVLPDGVFDFSVDGLISLPITKRFNKNGDKEPLATDFNTNLNSSVFSDLSLVETGFGLPPGSASFGRTDVKFTRHIQIYNFNLAYGLTDRLSVGVNVPYWNQKVDVEARLDNSTATVGFNPSVPGGVAPIGFAGTPAPTTEDIQNLLVSQGFRRVENWHASAFGDVIAGAKYQYYRSKNWRLAATGGVRFPTGTWDDPNNLVDNNTGYDAWGLSFRLQQDYVNQQSGAEDGTVLLTPGDFLINTTLGYDAIFPDKKPFRVCNIHNPICADFDNNVKRDTGDTIEAGLSGVLGVLVRGLTVSAQYTYSYKMKDKYRGDQGFDYDALAIESDYRSHIVEGRLSYSTIPRFLEKQFPLPLSASVRYRERVAGTNNQFNSRYIGFTLEAYF